MSAKAKRISYFIRRAKERIKTVCNAPKGMRSECLRLANEWLVLGQEGGSIHCRNGLEQLHESN